MIIAGIDEAGYGPLLGPLVVGCCAFEIERPPEETGTGEPVADAESAVSSRPVDVETTPRAAMPPANTLPCLWSRLRKHVGRTRSKSGSKIHVNDSKQVYSPSVGVRELERAVLSFISASGDWPASLNDLLARLAPHCLKELAEHSWYAEPVEKEKFPLTQEAMPIRLFAKSLAVEMAQSRTRCVYLAARVLSERPYNRMVNATRNKASVLFTQGAHHLDYLIRTFAGQDLHIFCDRQGGRSRYGPLLRMLFEDWSLEILHEEDGRSDYALHRSGRIVHITWAEKAEAQCLPAAMASMIAKYLREALMHRFNAYWAEAEPGVSPTAGYYTDGLRFLRDIAAARTRLGVADADLIRVK